MICVKVIEMAGISMPSSVRYNRKLQWNVGRFCQFKAQIQAEARFSKEPVLFDLRMIVRIHRRIHFIYV